MGIRTENGFKYEDGEFITFEDAVQELTDSLMDSDEEGFFSREEQEKYARFIINNSEDGAYL